MKNKRTLIALVAVTSLAFAGCHKSGQDYTPKAGEYEGLKVTTGYRNDTGRQIRIDWTNPVTGSNEHIYATEEFEYGGRFVRIYKHNVSKDSPLEGLLSEKSLEEAYKTAKQPVRE